MANLQAVLRRRENRRAALRAETRKDAERERFERDVATRMKRLIFGAEAIPDLILIDYRYWQLRACGWDVVADKSLRRGSDGKPCDPSECQTWVWWTGLHWTQRRAIRGMSKGR